MVEQKLKLSLTNFHRGQRATRGRHWKLMKKKQHGISFDNNKKLHHSLAVVYSHFNRGRGLDLSSQEVIHKTRCHSTNRLHGQSSSLFVIVVPFHQNFWFSRDWFSIIITITIIHTTEYKVLQLEGKFSGYFAISAHYSFYPHEIITTKFTIDSNVFEKPGN